MSYDPELPAGFQDADFEMAEMTARANFNERERKAGRCRHMGSGNTARTPDGTPVGKGNYYCYDCETVVPDPWGRS